MTTSGAWGKRCRATPTRFSPNAPERSLRSNRLSGRYRKSTGKAGPFGARFRSTSCWPKPGSANPTCARRSTASALRTARSSCLLSRPPRRSPRTTGSTSVMRRCFADGRGSQAGPDSVDPKTGRPPPGWLAEEQIDGQRYHTLLSAVQDGLERATLDDPERIKAWWRSLPRTAAWADRYGGEFELVEKRIDDSIEAKRRSRRNRRLAVFLASPSFSPRPAECGWRTKERSREDRTGAVRGRKKSTRAR